MRFLLTSLITLGVCTALSGQTPAKSPPLDRTKLADYLRHLELLPADMPVVIGEPKASHFAGFYDLPVEVTTPNGIYALHYYLSADGKSLTRGVMVDLTKPPFEAERKQLKTDLQPSFGTPGAPVVMVVFSDFQCPNCREEAKVLRENLQKSYAKDVRVYFKDFPLEKLHPWAKAAALAGRCVFRQQPAAFWDFHDWIYEHQAEMSAETLKTKILGWAEAKNVDGAKLTQCIDSKATGKEVDREIAEGRMLGVSGTPTIFINGRPMTGAVGWPNLDQILKREIEYAKKNGAGEKCCEVALPSLAK